MISLGMDLIVTQPDLPVTILWVCRTVQEFEVFSHMLNQATFQHNNLTVKVWITLSIPEPKISKEAVMAMSSDEEKFDLVLRTLRPPPLYKDKSMVNASDEANNYLFKKAPPGLEPLGNTIAMTIAMIFALVGYAASVSLARRKELGRQDVKSLIDMGIVFGVVLFVVGVIILGYPLLFSKSNKNEIDTDSSDDESMEFGLKGVDAGVYRGMLQGRIGCRPDIQAEFNELANAHYKHTDDEFDTVGVLACGPKAMTNAINAAVNNTGPIKTFFDAGKIENTDGSNTTFAFVEEDWEW